MLAVPGTLRKKPWEGGVGGGGYSCSDLGLNEECLNNPSELPLLERHTSGSREDSMEHTFELMDNVLDLKKEKDAQAVEILSLKKRVKKLEGKRKSSISHSRRRIYRQVESSDDDLDEEDASKQGRNKDKTKPITARPEVSAASVPVSVATLVTPPTTTTVFNDEDVTIAMAQTLIKMKEQKAKDKGVAITDIQQEEKEQFTIEERAKFLVETIEAQRKFRVAQRVAEIRIKPPTKSQLRNMMITYLKNMGKFTHNQLKGKRYEEKSVETEREGKSAGGSRKKTIAKKRIGAKLDQESVKRQKLKDVTEEEEADYEKEKEALRLSLKIIPNDDSEVNYEPLSGKFPIVNWEYQLLGKMEAKDMEVYKLTRVDGSSSYHGDIQAFLRRLDRQDLNELYKLVQERFQDHPLEGHDLLLWGDLRMIFDPDENNELRMNKLDWKLLRWKLHENCGVYTLFMDGTPMEINMLVEKKYPLIKELLEKILNLQLEAEEESTMAFELIKFIKSLLEE
ncbi:hypothetical protein Tco_1319779 [Tanacetum coccineum]